MGEVGHSNGQLSGLPRTSEQGNLVGGGQPGPFISCLASNYII